MESSDALDAIVQDGTNLYLSLVAYATGNSSAATKSPTTSYLMINDLPETAQIRGLTYEVAKLHTIYTGLIGAQQSDMETLQFTLNDAIVHAFTEATACFLTVGRVQCAYTMAIVKTGDNFLCFDSHSRTEQGISANNGKSVLLEVAGELGLVAYINDMARSLFEEIKETPFEFTPVTCTSSFNEPSRPKSCFSILQYFILYIYYIQLIHFTILFHF